MGIVDVKEMRRSGMTGYRAHIKRIAAEINARGLISREEYMKNRQWSTAVIESPYAGNLERNALYLRRAISWCLRHKESPYASHLMLTSVLDDSTPEEREIGIEAGLVWSSAADVIRVFTDYGISPGMQKAIEYHSHRGKSIKFVTIGRNPGDSP